jgi:hypothetical protein
VPGEAPAGHPTGAGQGDGGAAALIIAPARIFTSASTAAAAPGLRAGLITPVAVGPVAAAVEVVPRPVGHALDPLWAVVSAASAAPAGPRMAALTAALAVARVAAVAAAALSTALSAAASSLAARAIGPGAPAARALGAPTFRPPTVRRAAVAGLLGAPAVVAASLLLARIPATLRPTLRATVGATFSATLGPTVRPRLAPGAGPLLQTVWMRMTLYTLISPTTALLLALAALVALRGRGLGLALRRRWASVGGGAARLAGVSALAPAALLVAVIIAAVVTLITGVDARALGPLHAGRALCALAAATRTPTPPPTTTI